MGESSMRNARSKSKVLSSISIIWLLATILALFALENIWIDPWLRRNSREFPSLIPEPLSGAWFLVLLIVGLVCVFLAVAQVLVVKDRGIPLMKRIGTGTATFLALLLSVLWVRVTSGKSSAPFGQTGKSHSVTLTWKASKSAVKGYNVYRGTSSGGPYARVNSELVRELTYKDENVPGGKTYYYVSRSVDANGRESGNSGEITVTVP